MKQCFLSTKWLGGEKIEDWIDALSKSKGEERFIDAPELNQSGVYLIVRTKTDAPRFEKIPGRKFNAAICKDNSELNGADFSEAMNQKWVLDEDVVYIGKASKSLKKRLVQYVRYGICSKTRNHRGGRYIWLLKDCQNLQIYWQGMSLGNDPADEESRLLKFFQSKHDGKLPFANMKNGRARVVKSTQD